MADAELRRLERAYQIDPSVLPALNRARRRAGLELLRDKTIHYITADLHHRLGLDGRFDPRFGQGRAYPVCRSTEVWPRQYYDTSRAIHYTSDKEQITCKLCLRCINKPFFKEPKPPTHLLVIIADREPFVLCGAGKSVPTTHDRSGVGCVVCRARLAKQARPANARARRRQRRSNLIGNSIASSAT